VSTQNQKSQPQVFRGIVAGVAGGLAAAWAMNQFMAGPAKKLKEAVQSDEQNFMDQIEEVAPDPNAPKEDATMIAADKIVNVVTGGRHLSYEQKEKAGPVVHYTFGALMGGIYGGLAEGAPIVTTGMGTTFGGALFGAADMLAVPALKLSPAPTNSLTPALVSPFAAHLVYGATTEVIRRLVRSRI
jgi:putative membrane protein